MSTTAQKIDRYFRSLNIFPHIKYTDLGLMIVEECRRMGRRGLKVDEACTLVEQESGGRRIFGCDAGAPYCHEAVTRSKTTLLLAHIRQGGKSQGVGVTQVTYGPFLLGAGPKIWHPRMQMRVGFKVLNDLLKNYPYMLALEAYNDGNPRFDDPGNPYELTFAKKHYAWKERLKVD